MNAHSFFDQKNLGTISSYINIKDYRKFRKQYEEKMENYFNFLGQTILWR